MTPERQPFSIGERHSRQPSEPTPVGRRFIRLVEQYREDHGRNVLFTKDVQDELWKKTKVARVVIEFDPHLDMALAHTVDIRGIFSETIFSHASIDDTQLSWGTVGEMIEISNETARKLNVPLLTHNVTSFDFKLRRFLTRVPVINRSAGLRVYGGRGFNEIFPPIPLPNGS